MSVTARLKWMQTPSSVGHVPIWNPRRGKRSKVMQIRGSSRSATFQIYIIELILLNNTL